MLIIGEWAVANTLKFESAFEVVRLEEDVKILRNTILKPWIALNRLLIEIQLLRTADESSGKYIKEKHFLDNI